MKRLYSPFLIGWPGAGVLLLRLGLSTSLLACAIAGLGESSHSQLPIRLLEAVTAVLIAIGLWTPIVGVVVCLTQLGIALGATAGLDPALLRAAVGLSLAFLGPGGWSLDARLFGRRRVEIKSPSPG